MRLKSALWVAAYLRRCQVEGAARRRAPARRRGSRRRVHSHLTGSTAPRICYGPAPQSAFDAVRDSDRVFSPSLAEQPASDAAVEAYLAREIKFDPDVWIVEVEDRAGRIFSTLSPAEAGVSGSGRDVRLCRDSRPTSVAPRAGARGGRACSSFHRQRLMLRRAAGLVSSACQIATISSAACGVIRHRVRQGLDALDRVADRRIDEQQDADKARRGGCRAPWPPPRSARRVRRARSAAPARARYAVSAPGA